MLTIPEFADRLKLFDWLVTNKSMLIAQKKSVVKHADAYSGNVSYILDDDKTTITKAEELPKTVSKIKVRSVINTTKLFDSYQDVHIDQMWNKSIKETKDNYLVKQHEFNFDGIISDNVKVFTKQVPWHELEYNYEGTTQALIYDSIIDRDEMPDNTKSMFEKYRKGKVKQHSVGMRYQELFFAVNDERYKEEFEVWEKYFEVIANKQDALDNGYFWAVTQGKNIEGSAVVKGANFATPTLHVEDKTEPGKTIPKPEPGKTIQASAVDLVKMYQLKI